MSIHQVLARLEALVIDPAADEHELEELLQKRQAILDDPGHFDASTLAPAERRTLAERLARLAARDDETIKAIRARQEVLRGQLGQAARGRAAARGYRAAAEKIQPALDREG